MKTLTIWAKTLFMEKKIKNLNRSEHGFFELIPIILKTEHVILQGKDLEKDYSV